jgi:anti-sigma regulatory factor (Ser/Thr protein kinase)
MDAAEAVFRQDFPVKGGDFGKAGAVACRIKELLKDLGLDAKTVRRAAIVAYEAEMNVIMYAWEARIDLAVSPKEVRLVVLDGGLHDGDGGDARARFRRRHGPAEHQEEFGRLPDRLGGRPRHPP